jgi:Tfp pilus assembly protein PilN
MRAVNLIPTDQQRGAGGAAGRSGGGAYILLGALALLVAMAAAYVVTGKSVDHKKAQLARVTQQAETAEAHASSLTGYTKFSGIRARRVDTVTQLAASRFDWAHAMRELARVIPANAWLTSMTGTTSPAVTLAGGTVGSLRSSLDVPAITIQGCTTSQGSVAKLMAHLRQIDGVQRVALEDSTKADGANAGTGATDCRGGHAHFPIFNVDVFYEPSANGVPTPTAGTQTAAATTTASSSAPATTTAPGTTSSTVPSSGGTTP